MELLDKAVQTKTYMDTYLYSKYPKYTEKLTNAIMKDPVIDKSTDAFKDVLYEIKRTQVSESLMRILNSTNVVLLDCDEPLPRAFKVFCAKDFKSPDKRTKIFIDCTNVITKSKTSADLIVDATKLISHLINAGTTMIYHKATDKILKQTSLIIELATCFAKAFTHVVDYLLKISIQETSKIKTLYLSAYYFLKGIVQLDEKNSSEIAKKIAGISDREASIVDLLMYKASKNHNLKEEYYLNMEHKDEKLYVPESIFQQNSLLEKADLVKGMEPYDDIKYFILAMTNVMHFNPKAINIDIVVEQWMKLYGPGTVFGLEYFPAISAMITDAYVGGFLNSQKSIESICKINMVSYTKQLLHFIENTV